MHIRINKPGTIKLQLVFELLVCVFLTWYFLPISQALFWQYKTIIFGLFVFSAVALAFLNNIRLPKILIPILAYMLLLTVLTVCKIGDAQEHIRVSFTCWGTALLYFAVLRDDARVRIGKYLLALLIVTAVTSAVGVIVDNNAARTLSHAAADEELQRQYQKQNIGDIFLFQCLVMFLPILICLPKKAWLKVVCWVVAVAVFLVLVNASFTIALIVYVFTLLLTLLLKNEKLTVKGLLGLLILFCLIVVLLVKGSDIFLYLSNNIENEKIATRMHELRQMIYFDQAQGDAAMRAEQYTMSWKTFLQNPLGVGAYYSYVVGTNGLGYHSKILDDMARFGIFAVAFYVMFFGWYYQYLKNAWKRAGHPRIAIVIVLTWILLLFLNLGFRSGTESVIMLFLMPAIPLMVEAHNNKRTSKEGT